MNERRVGMLSLSCVLLCSSQMDWCCVYVACIFCLCASEIKVVLCMKFVGFCLHLPF